MRYILFIVLLISGCASHPPAPVVDRKPVTQKAAQAARKSVEKDWRPETPPLKRTTRSTVSVWNGYDYKEIAQLNNIPEPYVIRLGQQLKPATQRLLLPVKRLCQQLLL